ncbi:efflux transporter outer membrane subunit [Luteibacter sp. SG786]|uniref:efflux transporter outer membrane subunit n=1 Tax=Luteibacter sp. SG786 TaxID=2587130 RepID=UPI00142144C5|nr:efflux transporter outer membrane subunit [Luteibacter sp. SG786]NII55427.1 NodT family efflux transporter outer membrane factor (OMF) lipoprotein [Luteibacter sp. SG786]
MARYLVFALLVGAGLAGCASQPLPDLHAPVPGEWRHPVADAPAGAPVDLRGWWHSFADPSLDALVDRALANNLDVAQAAERVRAARALHGVASSAFLPQLHAKTEDVEAPDAGASYFVAGFDAVWELDLFGRGTALRRAAQGDLDAAAADLQGARVSLVAEVVRDWLQLRAAQQQLQWLQQVRDARQRQLDLLQVRERLRLAGAESVQRADAALAQADAAMVEPRETIDANAQRLAVLLGTAEPDPAWTNAVPLPTLGAWSLQAAPADLLRSRPEIRHAEADVLRAAGAAGIAHADRYPRVAIGGSLTWSASLQSNRGGGSSPVASIGPLIDIPLFDWGMRAAQEDAKRHELQASVLAYRQSVLEGVADVETALGRLQRQGEQERQCTEATAALARADTVVAKRAALHLAGADEEIESAIAHDEASLALVQAQAGHDLAFVSLFKALGGAPLPPAERATQEGRH